MTNRTQRILQLNRDVFLRLVKARLGCIIFRLAWRDIITLSTIGKILSRRGPLINLENILSILTKPEFLKIGFAVTIGFPEAPSSLSARA